jgi:lysylphosphatidylglycerol synthetase-like protein (DUF2156 family)
MPAALVGRVAEQDCRAFAIGSGVMLILMSLMSVDQHRRPLVCSTCPMLGDYELVQAMSAVAVIHGAALLPDDSRPHHRRFLHHLGVPREVQSSSSTSSPA